MVRLSQGFCLYAFNLRLLGRRVVGLFRVRHGKQDPVHGASVLEGIRAASASLPVCA